jgi:hypothetical protein
MDQTILKNELRTTQIHKHKQTYREKIQLICQFQFPKPLMRCIKMLLPLNENEHTLNLSQIAIQIFEKLVYMGFGNEIFSMKYFQIYK